MIENCGKCKFYDESDRYCRRFPPQVWGDPQSETTNAYSCSFPQVSEDRDWCGEFKQKHPLGWKRKKE